MFGFIYTLTSGIGFIISGIKCHIENESFKQNGINRYNIGNNLSNTYYDRKGIRRDIKTNQIADIRPDAFDLCDDKWLWLGAPGIKTKNLSREQRNIDFENGKKGNWLGRTVDIFDHRYWATSGSNKYKTIIHGAYYKDLKNNQMYVCREFPLYLDKDGLFKLWNGNVEQKYICKFYMNIKNGKLVRKADTQIQNDKNHTIFSLSDEQAFTFINQFNSAQNKGGWYNGEYKYNKAKGEILKKQNYYCNDFVSIDHIYNLITLQNNKSEAKEELEKEIYN